MDGTTARRVLGLSEDVTQEDVHRAFRRAVLCAHPDRGGDAARFRALVDARALLLASCPAARTPVITGGDRFRAAWAAPNPHTFDAVDAPRTTLTTARHTQPSPKPSFATVLEAALAA